MSWFQENKFAGTVLSVTAIVSGALVYLGVNAKSETDAAKAKELAAVEKINSLQASTTFPNKDNEVELEENLLEFASKAKVFQDELLKYRPEEITQLSPNQFNDVVQDYLKNLDKYYQSKDIKFNSNEKAYYGLGRYAGAMAKEVDTAYLNYHRKALEWLFISLADSGIVRLEHVFREPVAESMSEEFKSSSKSKTANSQADTSVSKMLPIEISFTGSEENLQTFLSKIVSSEEHFFMVKLLKIVNEKQDPVSISQMSFAPVVEAQESEGEDEGGGVVFPDFEPVDDDFAEDKTIIKQVVGSENITVFMKLDLTLFEEASNVVIPRLENAELNKK